MKIEPAQTAIVTGASGGIGPAIVEKLAKRGLNIVLAARSYDALEEVARPHRVEGQRIVSLPVDLTDRNGPGDLIKRARATIGSIDILINNAGVFSPGYFEDTTDDELDHMVALNITSLMRLTRLALPDMLRRNKGHIVNMGSLAGLGAAPFLETYSATKHAVVGFSRSLRASLQQRQTAVGVSVVCPGYVSEAGMYVDMQRDYAVRASKLLGTSSPEQVAKGVIRAIEKNEPELIVNPSPLRPGLATMTLFPRLGERAIRALGINTPAQKASEVRRSKKKEPS
jgi:short-subunit dehydrogenase